MCRMKSTTYRLRFGCVVLLAAALCSSLSLNGSSLAAAKSDQPKPFPREPSREALKWADKELGRMSLDEKIGQLIYVGLNATFLNQDSEGLRIRGVGESNAGSGALSIAHLSGSRSGSGHAFR